MFYFERWRGSRPVQRMSFAERGMFLEMLIEQWMRGDLPDHPQAVADAIATSEAQVGELHTAWPALRRQFVTVEGVPEPRIVNLALERVRNDRVAYLRTRRKAAKAGGDARSKQLRANQLDDVPQATLTLARSTLDLPDRNGVEEKGIERNGVERRAIPRAHAGTIFEGSLPREHRDHVFCDPSFSICVPSQVHAKLIGPLSRRFGGERSDAHRALLEWYPTVPPTLPDAFVMGDAFKFWQGRFDAAFASKEAPAQKSAQEHAADTRADADRLLVLLKQDHR